MRGANWADDLADIKLQRSSQMHGMLDSVLYCHEMLELSIFTWSDELGERFAEYIESKQFKSNVVRGKWVIDINLLERVAKDEVIRGYFSDDDQEGILSARPHSEERRTGNQVDLNFSTLKNDLQMHQLMPDETSHAQMLRKSKERPVSLDVAHLQRASEHALTPEAKQPEDNLEISSQQQN